ncbi:UDP-N-acetylmuramoyl-tripeptide--D-alanyl-D-alanine ligase [Candidatus Saccharibacteria bacterium CPR2]|nr:UDP-N-acetylmuramoyl-tripeptide--D-alanyl-D-alanine ligase [Candidatus Saccharibacteria bacterium CPR2]
MIQRILSFYHPNYYKTLVAMLQECEYEANQFYKWFWRRKDFDFKRHENSYKPTAKSKLLLLIMLTLAAILSVFSLALIVKWYISGFDMFFLFWGLSLFVGTPLFIAAIVPILVKVGEIIIQKPKEKQIIAEAARVFKNSKAKVIVVAGSYGKTSMKEILFAILSSEKKTAATPGNYNTPLGIGKFVKKLDGDEEVIIVEMGEYKPGDIKELCEIVDPDIGVITGINEQHHERFKTIDAAISTIHELSDYLDDKPVYINAQSPYQREEVSPSAHSYSQSGVGEWKVKNAKTGLKGTEFDLVSPKQTIKIKTKLLGLHQIGPICAAVAIAKNLGLDNTAIENAVKSIPQAKHRLQILNQFGATIIDDSYNGNPTGFEAGIKFLADLKNAVRKVYVTPGIFELGDKEEEIHYNLGKKIGETAIDEVVFVRTNGAEIMAKGIAEAKGNQNITWVDDPSDFYSHLDLYIKAGDVVMLQNCAPEHYLKK